MTCSKRSIQLIFFQRCLSKTQNLEVIIVLVVLNIPEARPFEFARENSYNYEAPENMAQLAQRTKQVSSRR